MPAVPCPFPGTDDLEASIVAALITAHSMSHASPATPSRMAEKVKRPSIHAAGTTEDWQYFKSRRNDYVNATRIDGRDKVIQLLECCDEQLRKMSTGTIAGAFAERSSGPYAKAIKCKIVAIDEPYEYKSKNGTTMKAQVAAASDGSEVAKIMCYDHKKFTFLKKCVAPETVRIMTVEGVCVHGEDAELLMTDSSCLTDMVVSIE